MAVPEQTPYKEYTANGVTTSFPLEFDCENQDHLIVTVNDIEPENGQWSLINGAVVFLIAPANQAKIVIQRNTPLERNTNYQTTNNSFRPQPVNKDFDRIWWKLQELGHRDQLIWLALVKEIADRIAGDKNLQNQINAIDNWLEDLQQNVNENTSDIAQLVNDLSKEIADRITNDLILKDMFLTIIDTAINEGTVNALAITYVDSLDELNVISNVWNGRTVCVTGIGNYKYSSSIDTWSRDFITDRQIINVKSIAELADLEKWDNRTVFVKDVGFFDCYANIFMPRTLGLAVSVLQFDVPAKFGSALTKAISHVNQFGGSIYVPCRNDYVLDKTVSATLQRHLNISADKGAEITVNTAIDFMNLEMKEFELDWSGGQLWANFGNANDTACFRLKSETKANSCRINNTRIAIKNGRFAYGIYAEGLNTSQIKENLIQVSEVGVFVTSENTNEGKSHAMATNFTDNEIYSEGDGIVVLNRGVPAVEGIVVSGGSILADKRGVVIDYTPGILNYLPPLYRIKDIHINAPQALKATAATRIYYDNVDHQGRHSAANKALYSGAIEVSSVTLLKITDSMFTSVAQENATDVHKISPLSILQMINDDPNLVGQWSNNVVFDDNIVDLNGMIDPIIKCAPASTVDNIYYGINKVTSAGAIISSDFRERLRMSQTNDVSNAVYAALGTFSQNTSFANNILTLDACPAYGNYIAVNTANNGTVNSIRGGDWVVGKVLYLIVNSNNVSFNVSADLETPDGWSFTTTTAGTILPVYFYTTNHCRVLSVPKSVIQIMEVPTSNNSPGTHGQKVYRAGFIYEYFANTGWVKTSTSRIN